MIMVNVFWRLNFPHMLSFISWFYNKKNLNKNILYLYINANKSYPWSENFHQISNKALKMGTLGIIFHQS